MKFSIDFSKSNSQTDKPAPAAVKKEDCELLDGEEKVECVDKTNPKGNFAPQLNTEEERFKMMFGKGSAGGSVNQMDQLK